ncbi:hypothetical protein HDU89_001655 [Geranomyces variabilis]|nr:hypothetical protein HDU89_001655 [Geranomyces variabilis]
MVLCPEATANYFSGNPRARAIPYRRQTLVDGIDQDATNYMELFLLPQDALPAANLYYEKLQEQFGKNSELLHAVASYI